MAVQYTGSITPGPDRIRDFRHRLLAKLGLREQVEVSLARHMCCAHLGTNDVDANSRVLRHDDWGRDARLGHDDRRPALALDGEAVGSEYAHLNAPLSGLELRHRRQGEQEYAPCAACPVQVIPGSGPARIRNPSAPDRGDRADSTTPGTAPVLRRDCEPRRLRWVPGCRHPAPGSKRCSPHCPGGSPRARIVRNGSESDIRRISFPVRRAFARVGPPVPYSRSARAATCKRRRDAESGSCEDRTLTKCTWLRIGLQHVALSPCLTVRAVRSIRVRRCSWPATTPCGAGRPAGDGTSRRWCEPPPGTSAWSGPAAAPGAGSGGSRSRTRRPAAD